MATFLSRSSKPSIAPGPRSLRLSLQHQRDFRRDPLRIFLSLQKEYGEIVRVHLGPYLLHHVTNPECIKQILLETRPYYVRGFLYQRFKLFMGESLMTTDGDKWMSHRRVAQPFFHRQLLNTMTTLITDSAAAMIERWRTLEHQYTVFNIEPEMMQLSLSILSKLLFTQDVSTEPVGDAVLFSLQAMLFTGDIKQMIPQWIPTNYNRTLTQAQATLLKMIDRSIELHRGELKGCHDIVSTFLAQQDTGNAEENWTEQDVRDALMSIFLPGHVTTGASLTWTLLSIAQYPEVRHKLEEELERVLNGRTPTIDDLPHLPYLRQVVDESLRMYPPVWVYPRDTTQDVEIGGYHIPGKTTIVMSSYAVHHNPNYWEDPETFNPERFGPEQTATRHRYAYFPFGGGQRQCIGTHLALLQLQLVVAMIVQQYHFQAIPGHPIVCLPLVTLRPLHGVLMTLENWERSHTSAA